VVVIAAMMLLPSLESVLRRAFGVGIPGAILWTQHLTLWIGFIGALLATASSGKHLALATGELLSGGPLRRASRWYVATLSASICALLALASAQMVRADSAQMSVLPGGIPTWVSELIMPVALAPMALRFTLRASRGIVGRALSAVVAVASLAMILVDGLVTPALLVPGIIGLLLGLALGAPVFVAMAGIAMLLFVAGGTPAAAVPAETFRLVASPSLPALPLLTVAGYVVAAGGAGKRLLRLARSLVGWMPGGVAVMVCLVCAGFTTFTGGSGVTILAMGGLVLPMLVADRYPEGFSLGLVTSSGSLGLLFPPSLPVILYAVVAQTSVEDLFIAGFVPGLFLVVVVAVYGLIVGVRLKAPRPGFDPKEVLASLWAAKWELSIPFIVLLSVFTGFATIVEAAALAAVFAVVSQSFVFRELHPLRDLPGVLVESITLVGAVLILLGVAMGLTSWLVDAEIPAAVLAWTQAHVQSQLVFLLALNAVLLVLGSVLEVYSAIIVLSPLLAPLAVAYGVSPIHLGIVFLANLELGFLFPPMGLNLILASSRFGQPLGRLYRVSLPFLLIGAVGVLLVTYAPFMTDGVLAWVRGRPAVTAPATPP